MKNDVKIVAFLLLITAAILVVVMVTKPSSNSTTVAGAPMDGEPGEGGISGDGSGAVIPPSDDGAFQTYSVKQGDTLDKIAKTLYAAAKSYSLERKKQIIIDANKEELGSKKEVKSGMKLRIPKLPASALEEHSQPSQTPKPTPNQTPKPVETPSPTPPPAPRKNTYVVKKGDYLYTIAKKMYGNGNLWKKIMEANPGLNPNNLKPGVEIIIPPLDSNEKKEDSAKSGTSAKSSTSKKP